MGQVAKATSRPPKASANKAASNGEDSGGENEGAEEAGSPFRVLLRGREQLDSTALIFEKATPEEALRCALEYDVSGITEPLLTWRGLTQAVALDYDREGDIPVDPEGVVRFFPEGLPRPLAAWVTHGGGLRVIFVETDGIPPLELAGAWTLLAPLKLLVGWRLEVKPDSRHPVGLRGEARCGRVHWFSPSTNLIVPGNGTLSIASETDIQQWLEAHGLTFGRHPTERCIWCGGQPASGSPAFVVEGWGVRCFRCGGRTSWDELLGIVVSEDLPSLYEAAAAQVHYPHQRHVLHDHRPSVPEMLLRPAWKRMLTEVHRDRLEDKPWAKRVARAASDHVDVVRGASGAWLDAKTLLPRLVNPSRTLAEMPWCHSGTMIDAAANAGPLRGFVAIQPLGADELMGPFVEPPAGSIFVARPVVAGAPPPIPLGDKPPDPGVVEQAWRELEQLLPGLHRGYLSSLVAARLFAQRGLGLPPIIVATGISGVGKTATQHLAAAATGTQASIVRLEDPPVTLRQIGLALEHGSGLVFVDEVGRVPDLLLPLKLTDGTQLSLVDGHRGARAEGVVIEMAIVERARRATRLDGYRPDARTPTA